MSRNKNSGYGGIAVTSVVVRTLFMPNPFEMMPNGLIINYVFSAILPFIAFGIVGLFYQKGSAPLVGALAFLGTYIGLTFITLYTMRFADWIGVIG